MLTEENNTCKNSEMKIVHIPGQVQTFNMFEGYTPFDINVEPSVTIHGLQGGSPTGPPLLLLHGYPQTHLIWHLIANELATKYNVVVLDLRGYGASSKPRGTENHENYSKRVMARDCVEVMKQLGHHQPFYVCGHDRGARVTHKLCIDYPDRVRKVILLDISPTLTMYSRTGFEFAKAYYHWFFLIQPSPLPENAILGNPLDFMERSFGVRLQNQQSQHTGAEPAFGFFSPDCVGAYVEAMKDPATVHATCEDYRAASTVDLEDSRIDIQAGRYVQCPLRVLWGKRGVVGRLFHPIEDWKQVSATKEVDGQAVDSGHYIPEESPRDVLQNIFELFQ